MSTPPRFASAVNATVPVAAEGKFAPLRLGPLEVWPPVVLAPMAGVTNYPFRRLRREFGAGLYVSEMITARGFLMMNRVTHKLADSGPDERPRSVQIYVHDPDEVVDMAMTTLSQKLPYLRESSTIGTYSLFSERTGFANPARTL